jgi:hypothetical protein
LRQIPREDNRDIYNKEYKKKVGEYSWEIWDELASEFGLKYKRLDKYVK